MNKLLVILGPTATGKTELALRLAKKFSGELVSADSRQVYTGLDIGTGKLPGKNSKLLKHNGQWIVNGVNIWVYDVVSPKRQYHVARFVKDAEKVIKSVRERKKLPILVGGTGLYIKAIIEGLSNLSIPVNKQLRIELEKLATVQLQKRLRFLSKTRWEKLNLSDRNNPRRLIRAIELMGTKPSINQAKYYNFLKIGLAAPREILYKRVDERVVSRINQGMVEEAKQLHKTGLSFKRMKQLGLEYASLADYLKGDFDKASLIKILQGKIHGYIRRQLTWFKKEKNVNWFDISRKDTVSKVEKLVGIWYSHFDAKEN